MSNDKQSFEDGLLVHDYVYVMGARWARTETIKEVLELLWDHESDIEGNTSQLIAAIKMLEERLK